MEKIIEYYETADGKCPYVDWLEDLDNSIRIRILKRVDKLASGIYGDYKPLQNSELSELKMNFGKGYRIYYYDLEDKIVLILAGSEKRNQKDVIEKANEYFKDYKKQKGLNK